MHTKEHSFTIFVGLDVTIISDVLLLIFVFPCFSFFSSAYAISPAFEESLISDMDHGDQGSDWVQSRGNESDNVVSDQSNILAVNYFSNGQTVNTTLWSGSNSENASS